MSDYVIVQPIACYRAGDRVLFFNDCPMGWGLLDLMRSIPREAVSATVDDMPEEALGLRLPPSGTFVMTIDQTPLPLSTPDHSFVAIHPSLSESVPPLPGPQTRAEEILAEAGETGEGLVEEVEAYLASLSAGN